jgi:hypothetical protein
MSILGLAGLGGLLLILLALAGDLNETSAQTPVNPGPGKMLATLDPSHPRLILKDPDLAALRKLLETDSLLQKCRDDLLKSADHLVRQPPIVYQLEGPRLLSVSRECVRRVYTLGLAWRLTGKTEYADKLRENLLAACRFKDWNPPHFLDTAEMSHAVGLGYDWGYSYFDEPTRKEIRTGLIENGLKPGLAAYADGAWWAKSDFNWNQVCNSGLLIGALAIAETDPDYAARILPAAVASLPKALATYDPDGAWPEGPAYWEYATSYTVYGLAAMHSALGTDFGLSDRTPGVARSGFFPLLTSGPTGLFFNFADAGSNEHRGLMPCLFWLARQYQHPEFAAAERALLTSHPAQPQDLIWYQPAPQTPPAELPLDKLFHGPVEVAVFRSAWHDPQALFVAVKAGYNQVNHGHLDLGNFEIDALGVRWASDLGADEYNLPGYWDSKPGGQRWTYYRLNSFSHNVPVLDGRNQDVLAKASFTSFEAGSPDGGRALIDLTSAYPGLARSVERSLSVLEKRRAVLVQDDFVLDAPRDVVWGLTTEAQVAVDGPQAVLTRAGKKCILTLLSPHGAVFTVESARQNPPQDPNQGVSRLMIRLKQQTGRLRLAVLFRPQWPAASAAGPPTAVSP